MFTMKGIDLMLKKSMAIMASLLFAAATVGCSEAANISVNETVSTSTVRTESIDTEETTATAADETSETEASAETSESSVSSDTVEVAELSTSSNGATDTTDMFTERDLTQTPDLTEAQYLEAMSSEDIEITSEGVYVISGTASDCTISVNAPDDAKVQLVLDDLSITNTSDAAILVTSCDKVFVTASGDSSLSVTGEFEAVDDMNVDAVIYSKSDLVLNGTGTLSIDSTANGVTSKDDMKMTGGTYNVTTTLDSFEANDSICIAGGEFNITSGKDAFNCENSDDNTLGNIYIADGTFNISATSDGIQGTTVVQIDGGTFDITSAEGIEGTYVQINGGTINITASDDGINATSKSTAYSVVAEFNGGDITIVMGQGDTDGVDSNGSIYVNGGTINITAQMSSFDYDNEAQLNGGTVIINGEQVTDIPQSMMGGGMGGAMNGEMGGGMSDFGGRRRGGMA